MNRKLHITRRSFLGASAVSLAGGLLCRKGAARLVPPSERIRLGVVGSGGMGTRHLEALAENPNCEIVAVCDAAIQRYTAGIAKVEAISGRKPAGYQDFRQVLDRQDIDAIFVVTPDHWHPLITILGCQAGKDVYVEKPVCTAVAEGRAMVTTARQYGRVVQVGTQQRSMPIFQQAIAMVHSGRIGQVTSATAWIDANVWSIGTHPEPVPRGLDWDMWLGPAPWEPYSPQRFGGFMGWHDYARGGQLTNWGVHLMDIVHWGIQQDKPLSVQALGGSYREAPGDNFDTMEAILEYPGCTVTWEQRHTQRYEGFGYGIKFQGTAGQLLVDRNRYRVIPESLDIPEVVGEPERSWANPDHHNNFFHCIKTRQKPAADIEQGFLSTTAVLLPGIALDVRRRLEWDAAKEEFRNDPQANRHLTRAYRAPWRLPV